MPDLPPPLPLPGSPEARKRGCTCPAIDNGHGAGRPDGSYWISADCPLHAEPEEKQRP